MRASPSSPSAHDDVGLPGRLADMRVVVRAYGVGAAAEGARVGGAMGEQVADEQAVESPPGIAVSNQ